VVRERRLSVIDVCYDGDVDYFLHRTGIIADNGFFSYIYDV